MENSGKTYEVGGDGQELGEGTGRRQDLDSKIFAYTEERVEGIETTNRKGKYPLYDG